MLITVCPIRVYFFFHFCPSIMRGNPVRSLAEKTASSSDSSKRTLIIKKTGTPHK